MRKRNQYTCLTLSFEQEERIIWLTERGRSAREIAEELDITAWRVASERARLQVRSHTGAGAPIYSPIRPKHVSKDRPFSWAWYMNCDEAFKEAYAKMMVEYCTEKGALYAAGRWVAFDTKMEAAE